MAERPTDIGEIVQITRSEYDRLLRERAAFAEVSRAVDIFLAATTCQVMSPDVCAFVAGNVTGIVRRIDARGASDGLVQSVRPRGSLKPHTKARHRAACRG
jgi:hypothetical protein